MPKSSSFTCPSSRDENVGGLQVAMQRRACRARTRRRARLARTARAALRDRARARGNTRRSARRPRTRAPGTAALCGDARVVETRDVRVLERREDFALAREALRETGESPRGVRELQRDRPVEHSVGALGEPNGGHAAATERANQPVRPDGVARTVARTASLQLVRGPRRQLRQRVEESLRSRCSRPARGARAARVSSPRARGRACRARHRARPRADRARYPAAR